MLAQALPKPSVFMQTYGRQMKAGARFRAMEQLLARRSRRTGPTPDAVMLTQTCLVRELPEHQAWSFLGRLGLEKLGRQRKVASQHSVSWTRWCLEGAISGL